MLDPFVRMTLLYSIVGVSVVGGLILLAVHLRRSYWRKRRRIGDPRAKLREVAPARKRR